MSPLAINPTTVKMFLETLAILLLISITTARPTEPSDQDRKSTQIVFTGYNSTKLKPGLKLIFQEIFSSDEVDDEEGVLAKRSVSDSNTITTSESDYIEIGEINEERRPTGETSEEENSESNTEKSSEDMRLRVIPLRKPDLWKILRERKIW